MKKFKKIILPYDAIDAENKRKEFWRQEHRGQYTTKDMLSLEELKEKEFEVGDNGEFVNELNDKIDTDLILDKLTPRQREVIELRMDGYSYKEIAKELGISEQGAKDHHMKANRRLSEIRQAQNSV